MQQPDENTERPQNERILYMTLTSFHYSTFNSASVAPSKKGCMVAIIGGKIK